MRHLLIYSDSNSIYSGVEQTNHELAIGLQAAGFFVEVAQPFADHKLVKVRSDVGVMHHWEGEPDANNDETCVISQTKPDLVLFSDRWPLSNLSAKLSAIEFGIPFVVIVHHVDIDNLDRSQEDLAKLLTVYDAAQSIIGTSQSTLDLLYGRLGLPLDRGTVIYPGRPAPFFAPSDNLTRLAIREKLNVAENGNLCLTIANTTGRMGVECYVNAVKQLSEDQKLENLHFLWIGAGSERRLLKESIRELEIEDRFHLIDPVDDIVPYLDAADVFVQLNSQQATPLVLIEALAKGLPIISTGVNGVTELVDSAGFLLPDPVWGSVATILAKTLAWMDQSEQLRREVGDAGAKRANQFFCSDQMVHIYLNLIEAIFYRLSLQETKKAVIEEQNSLPQLSESPLTAVKASDN